MWGQSRESDHGSGIRLDVDTQDMGYTPTASR